MKEKIAVVGLGYVGLPLAIALSQHYPLVGFDISKRRIDQLKQNHDWTEEHTPEELKTAKIEYTTDENKLNDCTFFIVTVPTPITLAKTPDLSPVESAARIIGNHIQKGSVVVLESTVYPGVTEEIMGKIIEQESKLTCGKDFTLGYSPERINPGDKEHTLARIIKVVSGQDEKTLERVSKIYSSVCKAGIFKASSIKVAEAAKVIENTQRDLNIALMNELSFLFHKMNISTKDVLEAAGTKWNFLKFTPGLVGGHCIGVDPYYLTYKAQELGYNPEVILAGRRINDSVPDFVVSQLIKLLNKEGKFLSNSKILVLGVTFKENIKDCRNSRVANIVKILREYKTHVIAHDPLVMEEPEMVKHEIDIELTPLDKIEIVDAVILAVAHDQYKKITPEQLKKWMPQKPILFDVKSVLNRKEMKKTGIEYDAL